MNQAKRFVLCSLVLISAAGACSSQPSMPDRIKDIVEAEARYAYFSGTVLVAQDDRIIYTGAFGYANRNFQVSNTMQTKFNIGSITKTFTALGILQLMEQGKIKAEDPLGKYLPDCPVPEKNDITIHHLLTHTSGLYDFANSDVIFDMLYKRSIGDMVPYIYGKGLLFRPGRDVSYSSGGYVLLGAVIEKVSGMPFIQYLGEKILKPARMKNTGLLSAEDVSPNKATGYKQVGSDKYPDRTLWHFPGSSAGGIYTTAEDLFRYVRALLDHKLLSAEYLMLRLSPKTKQADQGKATYGWWIDTIGSQETICHTGGTPGFSSSLYIFPGLGYTAIVLSNSWRGTTGITDLINSALAGRDHEISDQNTYSLRKGIDLYYEGQRRKALRLFDEIVRSGKPLESAYTFFAAMLRLLTSPPDRGISSTRDGGQVQCREGEFSSLGKSNFLSFRCSGRVCSVIVAWPTARGASGQWPRGRRSLPLSPVRPAFRTSRPSLTQARLPFILPSRWLKRTTKATTRP